MAQKIRSVELERLTAEGKTLIERRNSMEFFRDQAADQFERHIGSAWRPRSGSKVHHRALTSAVIDRRDFLAPKKRADRELLLPAGPKVAVTGGLDFNDHRLIWAKLDQVHAKHPDMVLLHCGCRRARNSSQPNGQGIEKSRRSRSSPTGRSTQGGAVQALRRDARRAADRRHGVPRQRDPGQFGWQAQEARQPGLDRFRLIVNIHSS